MKKNDGFVSMWDNWSKKRSGLPVYDLWLDDYRELLDIHKDIKILDLGCGIGADTLYLLERGYKVISCDFSRNALKNIQEHIPKSETKYLDMMDIFPFDDETFYIIIADLSLHYFDGEMTRHIMSEIRRILKDDGVLLARVAATDDYNFGAGEGQELEHNYYFEGDYTKRFFDVDDVKKYFGIIGEIEVKKTSMMRAEEEYAKPKMLYMIKATKKLTNI